MMIKFNNHFLILFTAVLLCTGALAQTKKANKIELEEVLLELEKRFNVRFSYRVQDVKNSKVSALQPQTSLDRAIQRLQRETALHFEVLNNRYIAISAPTLKQFCGLVKDAKMSTALSGATVITYNPTRSTITDEKGKFVLNDLRPGEIIHIQHLGFQNKTIPVSNTSEDCIDIALEPAVYSLQETVVVNYLTSGISKRQDGSTRIDTQRFGTLPGQTEPDILQTIEALPGIESVNETVSNINIRGGTSDQNLVLFDDIKMYLTGHFFGLISAFNPNLTKNVLVVKNGSSPRLNDGVSGTIDIRSEDHISGALSGGAGVSLINADVFVQVPVSENFEVHASGRRSINDLVDTPTYNSYFSRTFQDSEIVFNRPEEDRHETDFNYYDTSLKALYDPNEKHKLRFTFLQIQNQLNYTQYNSSSEPVRQSDLEQKNTALGGTWKADWPRDISTKTVAYLSHYRLDAMNNTFGTDQRLLQGNEVLETGIKLRMKKVLSADLELTNGYQFYEVGITNSEDLNNPFYRSLIKNVVRNHALYGELTYAKQRTFVKGGLRLNYLSKFKKFLLEPRISLNQKLGKTVSFKVLAELKSQTTSQIIDLQEDFLGVENRRWILADDETYPVIQSQQVSAGIDLKSRGWYVDLMGFYKEVTGISTSNQGFQDQNEFMRTSGQYISKGVEILVNKKWKNVYTYLNYTFAKSDYTFEELSPSKFPNNFDIRHSASLATNYSYKNFKFSVGGSVRSGKPYTPPIQGKETRREGNAWIVNYTKPNSENLPLFFRIDLSSSYTYNTETGAFKVGLGILNLLDRENVINRYYKVDETDKDKTVEINNKSLGLTPNVSLRFTF